MRTKKVAALKNLLCLSWQPIHGTTFITNKADKSRLGNNLLSYIMAKATAAKHNLPYVYTPFIHSNLLALHTLEIKIKEIEKKEKIRIVGGGAGICIPGLPNTQRKKVLEFIAPSIATISKKLPKDTTVAVHVRRGDIVGKPRFHYKFHTDKEYITAIAQLLKQLDGNNIYVHLYTDDPNPSALTKKYETAVKKNET